MENGDISIELLYKKLEGTLSQEEDLCVQEWLRNPEHQAYFENLKRFYRLEKEAEISEKEILEGWLSIQKRIRNHFGRVRIHTMYKVIIAAASVVIIWGFLLLFRRGAEVPVNVEKIVQIEPGQHNAILQLADGRTYDLKDLVRYKNGKIADHILIDSCQLNYIGQNSGILEQLSYNTLIVPRGGEFQITLEDGTKVWLNSASRLEYPEVFTGQTRQVYLDGEAYFEVAPNPARPFIVCSGIQKITVLGTSFGVTGYPDDYGLSVTLVEGKVKAEYPGVTDETFQLEPGNRVSYDLKSKKIEKQKVNVWEYVAWKDGRYVFVQKRLEDMLNTLSRWYDFQVVYQSEDTRDFLFSGELMRFENFNDILKMIEKSGDVKFSVDGRVVIVSK